jgi:hypothetical protein
MAIGLSVMCPHLVADQSPSAEPITDPDAYAIYARRLRHLRVCGAAANNPRAVERSCGCGARPHYGSQLRAECSRVVKRHTHGDAAARLEGYPQGG